ncbi:beta-ketoacyl-ACP synthase [Ferrimonas sp. YFM]|uniref:beta-ketoacyl-ACP synthase n=1 Tax=Ferrimonas sp. YFM TaxID=3028878 RepID=UPI0025748967|nr:beta-ketoacyl-ACP synthase [Ferrimonas sp. YFM]BDY04391.1 beta-ketoacyl-[acyl-carrier-protein] synthase II [Ferrimonas sp. YFM]
MNSYRLSAPALFTSLGLDVQSLVDRVLGSRQPVMTASDSFSGERSYVVGQAPALETPLPQPLAHWDCRNNRMLAACCDQISSQIEALKTQYGNDAIAVILGTSTSGIEEYELTLAEEQAGQSVRDYHYRKQEMGTAALFVAERFELQGCAYTVSTACSSAAKAMASAARLLDAGLADAVICGGSDSLCRLTVNGFDALESYSDNQCSPLTQGRDGINIGEAAVLFVMTREPGGIRLTGTGESSDAHHVSAPHPEGRGAEAAMRQALQSASLQPEQLDYINLHGTGTPLNDKMECAAIERVCGDRVPVSSTKTLTGHTLGVAGALEAALCWGLLSDCNPERKLPPQLLFGEKDAELAQVRLADEQDRLPAGGRILSNSFAFGGSNIALILERES